MISIQEMLEKTKPQRKAIEERLDRSNRRDSGFHPQDASILQGLGKADFHEVKETLQALSLREYMEHLGWKSFKEYLGSSGTTGIAGAVYMVPDKIYDILWRSAWASDITGATARMADTPGSTLKLDYHVTGQYKPKYFGSGGDLPTDTLETGQTTVTPVSWGIRPEINNNLIEDSQWDVVQMHLEEAAKAMAQFSSALWITTLVSASNGDGTLNTATTGATGVTDFQDIMDSWAANATDGYLSDTVITHPYAVADFASDASVSAYAQQYHDRALTDAPFMQGNFKGMAINCWTGEGAYGSNVLYSGSVWRTLVYNKAEAGVCVRKRWLRIENYSNPIADLVGATVTAREGYSTVNKDAICLLSENAGE